MVRRVLLLLPVAALLFLSCDIFKPAWIEWRHPTEYWVGGIVANDGNSYVAADGRLTKLGPDGSVLRSTSLGGRTHVWLSATGPNGEVCGTSGYMAGKHLCFFDQDGDLVGTDSVYRDPVYGADGTIHCCVGDSLVALYPDLSIRWELELDGYLSELGLGPDGAAHVVAGDTMLVVVNPDGTVRWSVRARNRGIWGPYLTRNRLPVDRAGNVYVPGDSLYAYSATGTRLWRAVGWCYCPALDDSGNIVVVTNDDVVLVRSDGSTMWRYNLVGHRGDMVRARTSPQGRVYVVTASEGELLSDPTAWLIAVEADGSEAWARKLEHTQSGPHVGPNGLVCFTSGNWFCGIHDN